MSTARSVTVFAAMVSLAGLAACGSAGDEPVASGPASTVGATGGSADDLAVAADPIRTVTTVLSSGSNDPTLCWGAVLDSLPPQCGGPRITNWDWTAVDHETRNRQRWGEYVVTGTYNAGGTEFTLTEPARAATTDDWAPSDNSVDWSTPCPEPAEGWHNATVTTSAATTSLPPDPPLIAGIEQVAGYGGAWYDQTLDVENVRIVGDEADRAAAEAAIAGLYDGAVCVVESTHTEAELATIQDQVNERYGGIGPGPQRFITATWVRTDARVAAVVVQVAAPVPGLEAALHDEFGDAIAVERSYTVLN
jgi:hypothetical protein